MNIGEIYDEREEERAEAYEEGYQQGRADTISEAESKVKSYASVWMSYNIGMSKDEIAEKALNCAKKAMIQILEQMKEQK